MKNKKVNFNKQAISIFLTFLFFHNSFHTTAQNASLLDTIFLQTLVVKDDIQTQKQLNQTETIDSLSLYAYQQNNLAQLLASQTSFYLKTYGQGGSATISLRGTNANHSQVLWQGIPLNSPVLGSADFSLLSPTLADQIDIQYQTASLDQQSGGLGGTIHLKQSIDWQQQTHIFFSQSINSLQNYQTIGKLNFGNKNFQSKTSAHFSTNQNRFGDIFSQKQDNIHIQQHFYFKTNTKQQWQLATWYATHKRQLSAREQQRDKSWRNMLGWQYLGKKYSIRAKTAYLQEWLHYQNTLPFVDDTTQIHTFFADIQSTQQITHWLKFSQQFTYTHYWANVRAYNSIQKQQKIATRLRADFLVSSKFQFYILLRQEHISKKLMPFLPAISLLYQIQPKERLQFMASLGRNYRHPTLNDWYWQPNGNPDLTTEKAWQATIGVQSKIMNRQKTNDNFWVWKNNMQVYYGRVNNWIQWLPDSTNLWRPQNFQSVVLKGLEAQTDWTAQWKKWRTQVTLNYTLTHSINQNALQTGDQSQGKQLIYTPLHNTIAHIRLNWRTYFLQYTHRFTSKRYVTSDNSSFLPAYHLADLHIGKKINWNKHLAGQLTLNCYNIWNIRYQTVAQRLMPQRYIGFRLDMNIL